MQFELPHARPAQRGEIQNDRYRNWVVQSWRAGLNVLNTPLMQNALTSEFRRYYGESMQQYFDEDRKAGRPLRTCFDGCKKEITTASDLRRWYGRDLCAECFLKKYTKERGRMSKHDRVYWDLVATVS